MPRQWNPTQQFGESLQLVQVLQGSAAYYSHNLILHVRECGVSCTVETRASASIIPAKSPKELRSSGILEMYVNVFVMFKMFLSGNFYIFFSHIIRICSNLGMSDAATLSKAECMYDADPRKIISRAAHVMRISSSSCDMTTMRHTTSAPPKRSSSSCFALSQW